MNTEKKPTGSENSAMMEVAFATAHEGRTMKLATCIALYLMLAAIWMPGFSWDVDIPILKDEPQKKPYIVIKPPPEKPLERIQRLETQARRVPLPDPDPTNPEPTVEPDPPPEPEILASDDWEIGIPEHVPEKNSGPILAGLPGVESPVITNRAKPHYPERAARIGLQGYVLVSAVLRKDGSIDDIKILQGLGKGKFGFEEEAIKAVKQWQFIPGKYKGEPSDIILNLKIDFRLGR